MKKLFIIVCILFLTACSNGGLFGKDPKVFIDAIKLGFAYEENESSATGEYDDVYIQITGIIQNIFLSKDEVVIQLFGGITCYITDNIELTDNLNKYNMITLNGTVQGVDTFEYVSTISIKDCEFIENITTPEIITTSEQASTLNLDEIGYEVIEITGIIYSISTTFRNGINLYTEEENDHLRIEFNGGFDFLGIEAGDTVTIMGVVMPYDSYVTVDGYKIFGYEITNIIKSN